MVAMQKRSSKRGLDASKKSRNKTKRNVTLRRPKLKDRVKCHNSKQMYLRMNVDPTALMATLPSADAEHECVFSTVFDRWKTLNQSSAYEDFQKDMLRDIDTVAMLQYNHKKIVAVLTKYLERTLKQKDKSGQEKPTDKAGYTGSTRQFSNGLYPSTHLDLAQTHLRGGVYDSDDLDVPHDLEPLLELIVALACDIPDTFHEHHLHKLLPSILAHRHSKDPTQVFRVFACVSKLLFILSKHVVKYPYELYNDHFAQLLSCKEQIHINDRACECLAFIIKKTPTKDLTKFFHQVFMRLKKDESQSSVLGKLITAVLKSPQKNRIDRCCSSVLERIFSLMRLDKIPTGLVTEAVLNGLEGLANFVTAPNPLRDWRDLWADDCERVWRPIWDEMHAILEMKEDQDTDDASGNRLAPKKRQLYSLMEVMKCMIGMKKGALMSKFDSALTSMCSIIGLGGTDEIGYSVSEILLSLLPLIEQEQRSRLINRMYDSRFSSTIILTFARHAMKLQRSIQDEILPQTVCYMENLASDPATHFTIMEFLAHTVVQFQPPIKSADEIEHWKPFSICSKNGESANKLLNLIRSGIESDLEDDLSNWQMLLFAIMTFPHMDELDRLEINQQLATHLSYALDMLQKDTLEAVLPGGVKTTKGKASRSKQRKVYSDTDKPVELDLNVVVKPSEASNKLLLIVSTLVEKMVLTLTNVQFLNLLGENDVMNVLLNNPQHRANVHLLRAIDMHLSVAAVNEVEGLESPLNLQMFDDMYKILAPSLASSSSQVRFLVTHILSLFPQEEEPEDGRNMFEVMHEIEAFQVTGVNFNERIRLMTTLDSVHVKALNPSPKIYLQAQLLFAIGQFHVNLTPLWGYLQNFIAELTESCDEQFWVIWFTKLRLSYVAATKESSAELEDQIHMISDCSGVLEEVNKHLLKNESSVNLSKRTDYTSVSNQMWKSMQKFPQYCQKHSNDLLSWFLDFMDKDVGVNSFSIAPTQDLLNMKEQNFEEGCLLEDEPSELEDNSKQLLKRKTVLSTTCSFLGLFSKFSDVKTLAGADKLRQICMDLLVFPNELVNENALTCILAFSNKNVNPYKEQLVDIQKDKSSHHNKATFFLSSSNEKDAVLEKHRPHVLPIYIRILYSKMGRKTSSNAEANKASIVRLLSGITDEESSHFINLVFEIMLPYLNGTTLQIVEDNMKAVDASKCIPLKIVRGIIGTLENVLQYLGNLIPTRQEFFLKVILFIMSYVNTLRFHTVDIKSSFKALLKKIGSKAMDQLLKFVEIFPDYEYTTEEMNALFNVAVWPNMKSLANEGNASNHFLLKLCKLWADNCRLHALFIKHHVDNKELFCLKTLLELASEKKCRKSVVSDVVYVIHGLVSTAEPEEENVADKKGKSKKKSLSTRPDDQVSAEIEYHWSNLSIVSDPKPRVATTEEPSFGLKIILPHVSLLSKCFEVIIEKFEKNKDFDSNHLQLVCTVSQYIHDEAVSENLLSLIVKVLMRNKVSNAEVVSYLLNTCAYLLPYSDRHAKLCSKLLHMFETTTNSPNRANLCKLFSKVAERHFEYKPLLALMEGLNSWEVNMLDSLDVERRVKSYKKCMSTIEKLTSFDQSLVKFAILQVFYDLKHMKDVSIETVASRTITVVMQCMNRFREDDRNSVDVLAAIITTKITSGCKLPDDQNHCTYLGILGVAVREMGDFVPVFADLRNLVKFDEDNTDNPLRFYKHMSSQQTNDRREGLLKLASALHDGSLRLKHKTVETYIWPVIERYIVSDQYLAYHGACDAAVECVGVIAAKMAWPAYIATVNRFMGLLKGNKVHNFKIGLNVVCRILDAFHEDVSGLVLVKKSFEKREQDAAKVEKRSLKRKHTLVEEDDADVLEVAASSTKDRGQEIYRCLVHNLMPKLKALFTRRGKSAGNHKVNKNKKSDEDDKLRMRLALPIVKLLKKFPKAVLDANLGYVFSNLCTILKSHTAHVRKEAKELLAVVLKEVGGRCLPKLIKDLRSTFAMGFTKIVRIDTIRYILQRSFDGPFDGKLKPYENEACVSYLEPGDIAKSLKDIIELCLEELFDHTGVEDQHEDTEERKVTVEESKGEQKSFGIVRILGRLVMPANVEEIILPLKKELEASHKMSNVMLVKKCMKKLREGLQCNQLFTPKEKLVFVYGLISNKIAQIEVEETIQKSKLRKVYEKTDHLLLEPEPKRKWLSAKKTAGSNLYVIKEFAFVILWDMLDSRSSSRPLNPADKEACSLLDSYVKVLADNMHDDSPDVCVKCLQILSELVKFKLPSLKTNIELLVGKVFVILNKFSTTSVEEGIICTLIDKAFECVDNIMKIVTYYKMTDEHARVLLIYIRENLANQEHQNTIFQLLTTMFNRNIQSPDLKKVVDILKALIVSMESPSDKAKYAFEKYFLNYPLTNVEVKGFITYFRDHLDYNRVQGRLSVCDMLRRILTHLPAELGLKQELLHSVWHKLIITLLVEVDDACRSKQRETMFALFKNTSSRTFLVQEAMKLIKPSTDRSRYGNTMALRMGSLSLTSFVHKIEEVDDPKNFFPSTMLSDVLRSIVTALDPDRFTPIAAEDADGWSLPEEQVLKEQHCEDTSLADVLETFKTFYKAFGNDKKWKRIVDDSVWRNVSEHCLYDEFNVSFFTTRLMGELFSKYLEGTTCPPPANNAESARSLVMKFRETFLVETPGAEAKTKQMAVQSIKNLIFLVNQSERCPMVTESAKREPWWNQIRLSERKLYETLLATKLNPVAASAAWVMSIISQSSKAEINEQQTMRRDCALRLLEGIVLILGDKLKSSSTALEVVIEHLAMEVKHAQAMKPSDPFAIRVMELKDLINDQIGWEKLTALMAKKQKGQDIRRAKRKVAKHESRLKAPTKAVSGKRKASDVEENCQMSKKQKEDFYLSD